MRELLMSITRKEWWLVGTIAFVTVVVCAVPYLYGVLTTPAGMVYTGVHHLTPGDTNVFLSMIEQVKQGDNVFINLYTAEPQHRLFINPLWLSVGWLGKIFNLSNLLALHLARSIWIIIFVFVVFLFIAYLFQDKVKRKWILLLVLFSSGLGIFFNPFLFDVNNIYEHPTDIWVSESITFLTLFHSPHLIASLTLLVLIFLLMLLALQKNKLRYSLSAGVVALFLIWFHPFNGPTVYLVLATYLFLFFVWQRKIVWSYIKHYLVLVIIPIPAVLYLWLISQADWVIRNWSAQNILPSPSIWMYLIGYGLLLPLTFIGLWISFKKPNNRGLFIVSWFICSAMLIYIPLSFQRRMSEGLHLAVALLAGIAIYYLWQSWARKSMVKKVTLVMFLVVFLPLTNFQILAQDVYLYQTKKSLPYYLHEEEVEAMYWLKNNLTQQEIIFSSYYMGNYIPAYSGRIVWIGHGPQTINLPQKKIINDWFWQDDNEINKKHQFLVENGVDYVYYGEKEKEIGSYNPDTKNYLDKVFYNNYTVIYRVL